MNWCSGLYRLVRCCCCILKNCIIFARFLWRSAWFDFHQIFIITHSVYTHSNATRYNLIRSPLRPQEPLWWPLQPPFLGLISNLYRVPQLQFNSDGAEIWSADASDDSLSNDASYVYIRQTLIFTPWSPQLGNLKSQKNPKCRCIKLCTSPVSDCMNRFLPNFDIT